MKIVVTYDVPDRYRAAAELLDDDGDWVGLMELVDNARHYEVRLIK
ncbi:hypothetical protein JRC04_05460 [Mycolicibacterium sp. S2-37]|nr:hypothetical protein [Mycolicibacterium sp. S2-37]MBO0676903.1 hypothetical protein [Mycolicibacterium sp. S2-37]